MIEVRTSGELSQLLLGDKDEFIGKVIIDACGLKYVLISIGEEEITSVPIDDLINMKEKDLREYFQKVLPADKIEETLEEINFFKKDISQLYT